MFVEIGSNKGMTSCACHVHAFKIHVDGSEHVDKDPEPIFALEHDL